MKVCFNCKLVQGYGMTETAAVISVSEENDANLGHVGAVMPHCEMALADVAEMNYLSTDKPCPRGEIIVRGPNMFKEYLNRPDATAEVYSEGRWLHTGDIGRINPNGTITIIDRKKNIFKLSQGEYVAVEKVEAAYMRCPLVSQTFVYGDSFKSKLVMVLVPEADEFVIWASVKGMRGSMKELCAKPEVVDAFFEHLNNLDYVRKLKGFETVKAIYAEGDVNDMGQGFSIENNCMTPTFKLRRPQLKERYQSQIDTMYASLGE